MAPPAEPRRAGDGFQPRLSRSVGWLLRSLACWRGPGKSRLGTTAAYRTSRVPWSITATPARPRPRGRRGSTAQACCPPCGVGPLRRAGPSWWPQLPAGAWRRSCAGPPGTNTPAGSRMASPAPGAEARGVRGHRVRRQSLSAAAPGTTGGRCGRAVVPGTVVRMPSPPVPGATSAAIAHGSLEVAASSGSGGARVGGGGWSRGSPGTGVSAQPPNKGLQATANSLRSCFAPALGGA